MIDIIIGLTALIFGLAMLLSLINWYKISKIKKAEYKYKESEWLKYAKKYENINHYENGKLLSYKKALKRGLIPVYIQNKKGLMVKNSYGQYKSLTSKEYQETYSTFLFPIYLDSSGGVNCGIGSSTGSDSGGGFSGGDSGGGDSGGCI